MKKIFIMIIAVTFAFGLSGMAVADTVTKIDGNKITIMDDAGKVKTVASSVKGLKVGDKVKVTTKGGLTWLNPQPEPPIPKYNPTAGGTTPEAPGRPPKTSPQLK
jgi:hypothetical protein